MQRSRLCCALSGCAFVAIALAGLLLAFQIRLAHAAPESVKTRVIVDLAGRQVVLPEKITAAACLIITSYEKMLLLGQSDKIGVVMNVTSPWAKKIFPQVKTFHGLAPKVATNPNVEDMLANKVDVVFFWNRPEVLAKMAQAGIPVVVTFPADQKELSTLDAFISFRKREMRMHGDIFGPEAQATADAWNRYFDEKINYVYSRTKMIPEDERPSVYYVRGPDALTTHGRYSYTWWDIKIAGGRPLSIDETKEVISRVPAEQLVAWDPDVIFMGWLDSTDVILKDNKWEHLNAVTKGKVFINPDGVYRADYGSEAPLLIMFFAKTLHPDLFRDLDMAAETKYFYSKFYHYDLSDDEVQRILTHRPPADLAQ